MLPSIFERQRQIQEYQRKRSEQYDRQHRLTKQQMLHPNRTHHLSKIQNEQQNIRDDTETTNVDEMQSPYHVVMGHDGQLYAIPLANCGSNLNGLNRPTMRRKNQGKEYGIIPKSAPLFKEIKDTSNKIQSQSSNEVLPSTNNALFPSMTNREGSEYETLPKSSTTESKMSILVEDASDSESDDDSITKLWRNRRPSPGQWMEPVGYFK
jgi:hypothetical protein